jgi:hypothetical protein
VVSAALGAMRSGAAVAVAVVRRLVLQPLAVRVSLAVLAALVTQVLRLLLLVLSPVAVAVGLKAVTLALAALAAALLPSGKGHRCPQLKLRSF